MCLSMSASAMGAAGAGGLWDAAFADVVNVPCPGGEESGEMLPPPGPKQDGGDGGRTAGRKKFS